MWRQAWSGDVSIPGRVLRLFLVVCYAPVLLVGPFFGRGTRRSILPPSCTEDDCSAEAHV